MTALRPKPQRPAISYISLRANEAGRSIDVGDAAEVVFEVSGRLGQHKPAEVVIEGSERGVVWVPLASRSSVGSGVLYEHPSLLRPRIDGGDLGTAVHVRIAAGRDA